MSIVNEAEAGPARIVLVEDDEQDAFIALRGIRKLVPVPSVKVIDDGASALRALIGDEVSLPELIFLDLKLPKVNGLEILEALRAVKGGTEVVVVILTSSDEPRDVKRAQELGCSTYLTKPLDWTQYMKLVCKTAAEFLPDTECVCG